MKALSSTVALAVAIASSPIALADSQRSVVQAPVVAVDPIIEVVSERIPHEICRTERVRVLDRGRANSATPAILGAVLGGTVAGAVGNKTGHQGVIAGAGALLGASVGNDIARNRRDQVRYVNEEVCSVEYEIRERERVGGYRVQYEFGDTIYETRMDREPGATIPVRVELRPLP